MILIRNDTSSNSIFGKEVKGQIYTHETVECFSVFLTIWYNYCAM
jgi:hypothetical protein